MSDDPPIRIYLSPPDVGPEERELLLDAFDSNWIAPLGPHVDAFEEEMAAKLGVGHAVALSSGTAALHLALLELGVRPGDEVLCPTLTFVATANAIRYVGAEPVFIDASPEDWNLDIDLVRQELEAAHREGRRIGAVVAVDLYGRCCDFDTLEALCAEHGVPLVEDAAEALGSTYRGRAAGTFGAVGVLSFNGNKIITTSGGGMLTTDDGDMAEHVRYLATQAREPAPHYEHVEVGYNYRMSNLLAAVGRGQLRNLDAKVKRRREIRRRYVEQLGDLPGVKFAPAGEDVGDNAWLTVITIDPEQAGTDRETVRRHLRAQGIEARPVWKPMHLQLAYAGECVLGGEVSVKRFDYGLCLPSGSCLLDDQQDEICHEFRAELSA